VVVKALPLLSEWEGFIVDHLAKWFILWAFAFSSLNAFYLSRQSHTVLVFLSLAVLFWHLLNCQWTGSLHV